MHRTFKHVSRGETFRSLTWLVLHIRSTLSCSIGSITLLCGGFIINVQQKSTILEILMHFLTAQVSHVNLILSKLVLFVLSYNAKITA